MGDFTRPQHEDCLTLTIWTPAPDSVRRPVLVWLHGGAYTTGAASLDWYDGSILSREGDIVVVGVNYRLGALGFLHYPGVCDGNLGIGDQQAALTWIRDHIAAFGGDPACVTVCGQSAGGGSIAQLLLTQARATCSSARSCKVRRSANHRMLRNALHRPVNGSSKSWASPAHRMRWRICAR